MIKLIFRLSVVLALSMILAFACGYFLAEDRHKQKLKEARSLLQHYMRFI